MTQGLEYEIENVMVEAIDTGLFVSLCTLQSPSGVFTSSGAPDGNYNDVADLVNIPCTAPPPAESRVQATTVRDLAEITASELHHVLLNGYYPSVDLGWRGEGADATGQWRAVIDGYAYEIMGVESDSQSQMTRMMVKLTTT